MPFDIKTILIGIIITVLSGFIYYKYQQIEQLKEDNSILIKNQETLKLSNEILENSLKESNLNKEIIVSEYDKKILDVKETFVIIEASKKEEVEQVKKIKTIKTDKNGYKKFFEDLKVVDKEIYGEVK